MKDYDETRKQYESIRDGIGYALCAYFILLVVFGVIGIIYRIILYINNNGLYSY